MLLEPARPGKVLRADSVMVRGTPMGAGAAVAVQEALAGRVLLAQAPGVSAGPGFTAALPETIPAEAAEAAAVEAAGLAGQHLKAAGPAAAYSALTEITAKLIAVAAEAQHQHQRGEPPAVQAAREVLASLFYVRVLRLNLLEDRLL